MGACNPLSPVVLVEDNEEDAFLITHALSKSGIKNPVERLTTGESLIEFLSHADTPPPCLLVADVDALQVDPQNCFQAFEWIKQHDRFKKTCIVVVSGWDDKRFEKSAEESGAYRFMSKDIMRTLLPEIAHEVCG